MTSPGEERVIRESTIPHLRKSGDESLIYVVNRGRVEIIDSQDGDPLPEHAREVRLQMARSTMVNPHRGPAAGRRGRDARGGRFHHQALGLFVPEENYNRPRPEEVRLDRSATASAQADSFTPAPIVVIGG